MAENTKPFYATAIKNQEQATHMLERVLDVAQPKAVYSEPLTVGEYTVINASEVSAGLGFGYGIGSGKSPAVGSSGNGEKEGNKEEWDGFGSGGGGGGGSMARPVAVISVGPQGVRVEPVVDVTKLGLTALMTIGSLLMLLARMRRMSHG